MSLQIALQQNNVAVYGGDRYFLFYNSIEDACEVAELPIHISVGYRTIICEHIDRG